MTVKAVIGHIYLAADKVAHLWFVREVIDHELVPFFIPVELLGHMAPEVLWILYRPVINRLVLFQTIYCRIFRKFFGSNIFIDIKWRGWLSQTLQ